jgi:hypothetical protein
VAVETGDGRQRFESLLSRERLVRVPVAGRARRSQEPGRASRDQGLGTLPPVSGSPARLPRRGPR